MKAERDKEPSPRPLPRGLSCFSNQKLLEAVCAHAPLMALTTITGQPVGALYHGLTMRENICKTNHNSIYLFRIKSSRIPSWPQLCSATTHGTHHPTWDCVVLGTELRASCILDMNRHGRQASTSLDLHCFAFFFSPQSV